MKTLLIILLSFVSCYSYSQLNIGFQFGITPITDRDEVMYIDNPVNFGGEAGVNVSLPFLNKNLAFETGLLFYDYYYRLRGPEYQVWFNEYHGSMFRVRKNMNDFGLDLPIAIAWNKGMIRPFLGAGFQQSLSSNRVEDCNLGGYTHEKPEFFNAKGQDIIELSSFTWYINGGINFVFTPKVGLKLQYSLGMNDFVTHNISPKIINDVNYGTTVQSSRINKFQLAMVFTPAWGGHKDKTTKRSFKEKVKGFYQ
jgi:hypothetical protein